MFDRTTLATMLLLPGLLAAAAAGQAGKRPAPGQRAMAEAQGRGAGSPLFVDSPRLLGAAVVSTDGGAALGELDDLVVDVREGRAVYGVLAAAGGLGLDGRRLAVPYAALQWQTDAGRYALQAGPDDLGRLPEFDAAKLDRLVEDSWLASVRDVFGDLGLPAAGPAEDDYRHDEYTWLFRRRPSVTVEGPIVAATRGPVSMYGRVEEVLVTVENGQNDRRRVLLGPAWYLRSREASPQEGDRVTVTGVEAADRGGRPIVVARRVELDGAALRLRDEQGVPVWNVTTPLNPESTYYMLVTDLDDGAVLARGESFGEVETLVLDARSGALAFATVTVGGVLGVGEARYPVPWEALRFDADHDVYLDRPPAELRRAPALSAPGAADLNDREFRDRVYSFHEVRSRFGRRGGPFGGRAGPLAGWVGEGAIVRLYREGEKTVVEGTVASVLRRAPLPGVSEGVFLVVGTPDGVAMVCLGPAWFIEPQEGESFRRGRSVRVEARRAEAGGRDLLLATALRIGDRRMVLWDEEAGRPRWDTTG